MKTLTVVTVGRKTHVSKTLQTFFFFISNKHYLGFGSYGTWSCMCLFLHLQIDFFTRGFVTHNQSKIKKKTFRNNFFWIFFMLGFDIWNILVWCSLYGCAAFKHQHRQIRQKIFCKIFGEVWIGYACQNGQLVIGLKIDINSWVFTEYKLQCLFVCVSSDWTILSYFLVSWYHYPHMPSDSVSPFCETFSKLTVDTNSPTLYAQCIRPQR